jgi:hypothetical protein
MNDKINHRSTADYDWSAPQNHHGVEISGLEPLASATGSTTVYWTLLIKSTIEGQQSTIAFPPNTAHNFHCTVLSKEQLLPKAMLPLEVLKNSNSGRTRNKKLFFFPPTLWSYLKKIALLRPFLPNQKGQLMRSTSQIRVCGRSVTPGWRKHPWSDLVVPTGWRWWGRSMAWLFLLPPFFWAKKGWREIVHQVVRKGQLDPLPRGSYKKDP